MYEKNEQRTDDRTDLQGLSDQQLIEGCLEGNGKENRPAWNEFFRRFIKQKMIDEPIFWISSVSGSIVAWQP